MTTKELASPAYSGLNFQYPLDSSLGQLLNSLIPNLTTSTKRLNLYDFGTDSKRMLAERGRKRKINHSLSHSLISGN